jgi:hypothetical protein
MKVITFSVTIALEFVLAATPSSANCSRTFFRFGLDQPTDKATWKIEKNTECSTRISSGAGRGLIASFGDLSLVQAASHGLASVGPNYRIAYQPTKDYIGTDHFSFEFHYAVNGTPGVSHVDITIDVYGKTCKEFLVNCAAFYDPRPVCETLYSFAEKNGGRWRSPEAREAAHAGGEESHCDP